jgi:hypothetical protein
MASSTPGQAPVRRTTNRPGMVPLSDFGKPPPPPPRHKTNWRNVAISVAVVVLLIAVSGYWIASSQSAFKSVWGQSSCLDKRSGC